MPCQEVAALEAQLASCSTDTADASRRGRPHGTRAAPARLSGLGVRKKYEAMKKRLRPIVIPIDVFTDDSLADKSQRPWLFNGAKAPALFVSGVES